MKIAELIEKTGCSRQTIHYYIGERLLEKPSKSSKNQADYSQEHVERLFLIKELQNRFFLPLSVIKRVLRNMEDQDRPDSLIRVKAEYFKPEQQFLHERIDGEESFLRETGLSAKRLKDFEKYRIISPTKTGKQKTYSQDDVTIGKVIGTMRRIGFSHERGFPPALLKNLKDRFEEVVFLFDKVFVEAGEKVMTVEELDKLRGPTIEVMAVFFYHLFRRLAQEDMGKRLVKIGGQKNRSEK